jgi:hypothetical protein
MEEYPEMSENRDEGVPTAMERRRWLIGAIAALAVGLALGYAYRQQIKVRHLVAQESVANATINDLQRQLKTMADELHSMVAAQQATADAVAQSTRKATAKTAGGAHSATHGGSVDKRYDQLQAQLTEQQKQLKETQDLIAKNRTELEGSLNSTRVELDGSIAKTHEELVALAKRGERSYFEFDLAKSKQFQRFGPLTLSLRKADTKHNTFDMVMIVDDNELTNKKVNLYEPIWIHAENETQPVQVVVNRIAKDRVHGYVSVPKYKPSELAAASAAAMTPPVRKP